MTDRLEAFTVRKDENGGKGFWFRIGTGWPNKAGGWNIKLDALPVNGEIVLMPPKPKDDQPQRQDSGPRQAPSFDNSDDIPF